MLSFVGEAIARRHVIPTICCDCDYVATYAPGYPLMPGDPTLFKVVKGRMIAVTDIQPLPLSLMVRSAGSYEEGGRHPTYSLNIYLQEDLAMYSNTVFSREVLRGLKDAMREALKANQAYKLLTSPRIRNAAFDYVCLKMLEESRRRKVVLKLKSRGLSVEQGSPRPQGITCDARRDLIIDLPEFKLRGLKLVEVKSSARTIKKRDVLSEVRWDIKRKLRRLSIVNDVEVGIYVVVVFLERERLRKAKVITYEALIT